MSRPVPQSVEFTFKGLSQKESDETRDPANLERAINVEFDKQGSLIKRLGYRHVSFVSAVGLFDDDEVAMHLAQRAGELLVMTHDRLLGLASADGAVRGEAGFVYRGPAPRGNVRAEFVSVSRIGTDYPEPE
jgi:hypothetical protein